MVERPALTEPTPLDPTAAVRRLTVAVRVGALLLGSGASTDEVEVTMRRIAAAYELRDAEAVVTLGMIVMSAFVDPDHPPITELRLVRDRSYDYGRLMDAARLADRILGSGVDPADALVDIAAIERIGVTTSRVLPLLAGGVSAAASTVLFGGDAADAGATLVIAVVIGPVVAWLDRSRLPPFFQTLIAPFLATLVVVLLDAVGLPIHAGIVVTGSILRFLPGAALVAGMRDLIDGSIISGSARLAEALLFGSAVGFGTAVAIQLGVRLGGPAVIIGELGPATTGLVAQIVAAALSAGFFAIRLGVRRRLLPSVFVLGGLAWAVFLAATPVSGQEVLPEIAAAVAIGSVGQWLADRDRLPSVMWTVPAILPLLPGLAMVKGILNLTTIQGVIEVIGAVGTGLALGVGVALGAIIVATARRVGEDVLAPIVVQPVASAISSGIDRVRRSGDR